MQLADINMDNRLYLTNLTTHQIAGRRATGGRRDGFVSRLKATNASERLLALTLAGLLVAASPTLVNTVRSVVSLTFQILLEAGRAGLIAFQIFGR
jgi:hypothetical protein